MHRHPRGRRSGGSAPFCSIPSRGPPGLLACRVPSSAAPPRRAHAAAFCQLNLAQTCRKMQCPCHACRAAQRARGVETRVAAHLMDLRGSAGPETGVEADLGDALLPIRYNRSAADVCMVGGDKIK
eukprot:1400974-Prymnesium_polylepis.1